MGCSGACCAAFPVGATSDHLKSGKVKDGDLIAFMLRKITLAEAADRRAPFPNAQPINLGPLVLRSDTAALYALSIVNYELETWATNRL